MAFDPRFTRWRALFVPEFWRGLFTRGVPSVVYWPIGWWKQLQPKPKKPKAIAQRFWRKQYLKPSIGIPTGRIILSGYAPSQPGIPAGRIVLYGYAPSTLAPIPAGKIVIRGIPLLFAGTYVIPAGRIVISGQVPTLTNYVANAGQISCCTIPDESIGGNAAELQNWAL